MKTITLPTHSELSRESYLEAKKLLGNDIALVLTAADEYLPKDFTMWLWDNHRVTSILPVPKEILKYPNAWALGHSRLMVVEEGF